MRFENSNATVVVNDHHGQYIAQVFAERYKDDILKSGFSKEDLDILLTGPDHEHYLDTWSDLFPITLTDTDGKEFVFDYVGEGGDIWEIPKDEYDVMDWDEI